MGNGICNCLCADEQPPPPPRKPPEPEPILATRIGVHDERKHPPPDFHDMIPSISAIEMQTMQMIARPLPSTILVKEKEEAKIIQGTIQATWGAIDDQRLWIRAQLLNECLFLDSLAYLIVEYVGCLSCEDPSAIKYRRDVLRIAPVVAGPGCGHNRPKSRTACRYCGLTFGHHYRNREPQYQGLYDSTGSVFDPTSYYCSMRCPLHTCIQCKQPFVKVTQAHLCVSCVVAGRRWPARTPKPRWMAPETENHYADELSQYVQWVYTTRLVNRTSSGKHGTRHYTTTERCIDREKTILAIRAFLDKTEYTCVLCTNRFRLAYVLPATMLTLAPNDHSLSPGSICGFCIPPQ